MQQQAAIHPTRSARPGAWMHAGMALLLSMVVGCGDEITVKPTRETTKSAAPAAAAGGAAPAAAAEPPKPEYSYSPIGKRDPFRSYLADLAEEGTKDKEHQIQETERYELDQYRLTELITATAQPKALVEDPTGRGHVIHIGSRLGKNGGRVTKISNSGIVITEEFRDPTGQRVRVPIAIKLPRPEMNLLE